MPRVIYETLEAAQIQHDEGPDIGGDYGPYIQSERKDMYKKCVLELVDKGHAYYCFCQKMTTTVIAIVVMQAKKK